MSVDGLEADASNELSDTGTTTDQGTSVSATPKMPSLTTTSPSTAQEQAISEGAKGSESSAKDFDYYSLLFRDGLDMPIPGLELFVTLPSGQQCNAISTAQGSITLTAPEGTSGEAKVEVKDEQGNRQQICRIQLSQCEDAAIIRSPKVKVPLPLRPHAQSAPAPATATASASKASSTTSPAAASQTAPLAMSSAQKKKDEGSHRSAMTAVSFSSPWWTSIGSLATAWQWIRPRLGTNEPKPAPRKADPVVAKLADSAGQPTTAVVGPEAPNKENLRLGRNNVYRQAILDASKRLGLVPQALCALMDCEAGKVTEHIPVLDPDGKQLFDKKKRPRTTSVRELWNANAGNAQSGAAGLTQFLASTWLAHVLIPGRFVHNESVKRGWVREEINPKSKKSSWVFVLADGNTTSSPYASRSDDKNVQACLEMRMDPTWSIHAAADYGSANLKVLSNKGFKLDGLNDMDKAKLMYLMHHEGEGAGPLFVQNRLASNKGGTAKLQKVFATQLGGNGSTKAQEKIDDADGDVEYAYRKWLSIYIDKAFDGSTKYFFANPLAVQPLSPLMVRIGGEKI